MDRKRKILLIEDLEVIRKDFTEVLTEAGYQVDTAVDGLDAMGKIEKSVYDLVILDRKLNESNPYGRYNNGVEFAEYLRDKGHVMPILAVSAYIPAEDDVLNMKKAGINGFLRKKDLNPTTIREKLPQKIESTISSWKNEKQCADKPKISVGDFTLDLQTWVLNVRGTQIKCTKMQRDILEVLMRKPRSIVTREEIHDAVWKSAIRKDKYEKTIATHISNLNSKYREQTSNQEKFVEMVGDGYVLRHQALGLTE
ncbi:MAG: response regulator transcription factor [Acidiferrobacterales bacterium]|nr:response regulator transcription factor [Acidiferrobacterales bacterium]